MIKPFFKWQSALFTPQSRGKPAIPWWSGHAGIAIPLVPHCWIWFSHGWLLCGCHLRHLPQIWLCQLSRSNAKVQSECVPEYAWHMPTAVDVLPIVSNLFLLPKYVSQMSTLVGVVPILTKSLLFPVYIRLMPMSGWCSTSFFELIYL